jgi:hypothetical protein
MLIRNFLAWLILVSVLAFFVGASLFSYPSHCFQYGKPQSTQKTGDAKGGAPHTASAGNQDDPGHKESLAEQDCEPWWGPHWFLVWVTIGLCLITGALAYFTAYLYWTTRKLAGDAEETGKRQGEQMAASVAEAANAARAMADVARHVETSANTGVEILENSKKFAIQQMRAYISVLGSDGTYQDQNWRFQGNIILLNTGNTPAHKVRWRARADIMSVPLPADFLFPLGASEIEEGPVLGPHQNFKLNTVYPIRVPDAEVAEVMLGVKRALYVWGIVTYDDVFKATQTAQFCLKYMFRGLPPDVKIDSFYDQRHNEAT